jgi:hypothetical protein
MKKFGFINNSKALVLLFLFLIACDGIFVPDPIDPRIPKYTEEGNNVAGAFINDKVWESIVTVGFPYTYNGPFITVWQESDSLLLRFNGNSDGKSPAIEFHLTGLNISRFEDLITLEGRKIQLDGIKNAGYYIENYAPSIYDNKGVGQIYFRNVRMESSSSGIILSGTFGFSINDSDGKMIRVTSGRFDYRITENINFQTEW